ncbi:MAG: hypothetical protein WBB94_03460, partial [Candidatus Saccharimonadaceae bacterium]
DDYNAIQAIGITRARTSKKTKKSAPFSPFQQFIFCNVCNNNVKYMVVGASGRVGQKKLYMRCDNKACEAYGKSIRAHVLLDDLTNKLENMKFTSKDYDKAKKYFAEFGEEKKSALLAERDSLAGALKHEEREYSNDSLDLLKLPKDTPASSRKIIMDSIKDKLQFINERKAEIAKIDKKLELSGNFTLSVEEFLNIANVAADKMRAGDPVEKDAIARLLLLNIEMGYKKAPSYRWKEPFATLINQPVVNLGAVKRT